MKNSPRHDISMDRARLDAVVDPVVRAHGGEVVDLEWKQEPGGWVLRVFVEKAGSAAANATTENSAVSLELCAGVARDLSPALDVADVIPHRYHLEVSSPGVERPLRDARDYARFAGQKAKLRLRDTNDGQKVLVGVIEPALTDDGSPREGYVAVRDGARSRVVPLDQVSSARLVFEFGGAPKPGAGKPGKGPKPTSKASAKKAERLREKQPTVQAAEEGGSNTEETSNS